MTGRRALLCAVLLAGCHDEDPSGASGSAGGTTAPPPTTSTTDTPGTTTAEECDHPRPEPQILPFADVTAAWGIDFRHHAATGMCDLVDTVAGPGACAFDHDGDGDIDLYFVDRAPYPNRLYRNDGGHFTDVTEESGAGVTDDSQSCLAFDADSDGDLDLFVGHLVTPGTCPTPYCWPSPVSCKAEKNALYLNDGGLFQEVTDERGLTQVEPTLSSLFFDIDEDGDLDLFVGNDIGSKFPDRLYRNDGQGFFTDEAPALGLALPDTDTMGVDIGDADGDGTLDLVVSDYKDKPVRLARCPSAGAPCEMIGIDKESTESTKWSVALADLDQDADLDIFVVAGNTVVPKDYKGARSQLHLNDGTGVFTAYLPQPGEPLDALHHGRGGVLADLDGDLDLDVVIAAADGPAQVLRNEGAAGHALLVQLDTLSAGARVSVQGAGRTRTEQAILGGSYAGSSDPRVHFGLGDACAVDVTVTWPGGATRTIAGVQTGQLLRVDRPLSLPGQ